MPKVSLVYYCNERTSAQTGLTGDALLYGRETGLSERAHYKTCATGELFGFFTVSSLSVGSDNTECHQRPVRCFYRTRPTAVSWEHSHIKCIATVVYGKITDSTKRTIRCCVNEALRWRYSTRTKPSQIPFYHSRRPGYETFPWRISHLRQLFA
jgi:hypothetical protein